MKPTETHQKPEYGFGTDTPGDINFSEAPQYYSGQNCAGWALASIKPIMNKGFRWHPFNVNDSQPVTWCLAGKKRSSFPHSNITLCRASKNSASANNDDEYR